MKNISRIIIALLILAMTLPMVISCAETTPSGETTAPAETVAPDVSAVPETTVEETLFAKSDIPEDLRFDGSTVNILYWDDVPNIEFFVEDQTGEAVNDAIYKRNAKIQEQFGVELSFTGTPGDNGNMASFVNVAVNSTQAGADAYDLFCGYSMTGATLMTQGVTQDLTNYEIMEFDKPWWPKSLISKATIRDGIYFASGDISTNFIHMMYLVMFNKEMLADIHNMGAEALYELAYNGTWTLDKLIELTEGTYVDQDGDNTASETDRYGLVVTNVHFDPFYAGSGLTTVDVNADGNFVLSPDLFSQKTVDLLEKLCNVLHVSGNAYIKKSQPVFAAGNALFIVDRPYIITRTLTDAGFNFGILPIPKYDESQENYATLLGNPFSLYAIPKDSVTPDMAGAVLECMASESYRKISPALYEVALKLKYSQDDVSAKMFDIAKSSVVFDLGRILSNALSGPASTWQKAITGSVSWTTTIKAQEKPWNKQLEKMLQVFE